MHLRYIVWEWSRWCISRGVAFARENKRIMSVCHTEVYIFYNPDGQTDTIGKWASFIYIYYRKVREKSLCSRRSRRT